MSPFSWNERGSLSRSFRLLRPGFLLPFAQGVVAQPDRTDINQGLERGASQPLVAFVEQEFLGLAPCLGYHVHQRRERAPERPAVEEGDRVNVFTRWVRPARVHLLVVGIFLEPPFRLQPFALDRAIQPADRLERDLALPLGLRVEDPEPGVAGQVNPARPDRAVGQLDIARNRVLARTGLGRRPEWVQFRRVVLTRTRPRQTRAERRQDQP